MDAREARRLNLIALGEGMERKDLAAKIGVSYGQIGHYLSPTPYRNIGDEMARRIEAAFGKDRGWLDHPHEDAAAAQHKVAELDDQKYILVSRHNATAGLGSGRHNEHVEISGSHAYRRDWIVKMGWRPEALAVIDAEGPSMAPAVNDGDVVLVNTDETAIKSGEVYAIEDAHQGTRIKRLFRTLDGRVRVASDNPDKRLYPDDYLTPESGARVIGRVVHRSGAV